MRKSRLFLYLVIFSFIFSSIFPTALAQGVPTVISYQGRLADSSGNLLGGSGTTYYFKFSIWDNATVGSGSQLYPSSSPSSVSATVRQGVFTTSIDVSGYNFNREDAVYLQVEASSDNSTFQTLSPRQRVTASAFAELAGAVSGTGSSSFGTTTPITNSQVTVEATTTTAIPLALRGASGQTANLFQIQNASASNLFYVNSSGAVFASSTLQVAATTTIYSDLVLSGTTKFNGNTYTWPSSIGAGNFLQTDASGNLTWASTGASAGGWTDGGTTVSPTASTDLISFTQGSSTMFSVLENAYFGRTATSTFDSAGNLNLASTGEYYIGGTNVLDATTLGSSVLASSLTSVGTLSSLAVSGLSTLTGGIFTNNATSTITNLTTVNATSTNATTTRLAITGLATPAGTFLAVNPNGQVIATTTPSGSGSVSSVSNANGTLTISPTTGAVVASLNLGNANTWTALQSFSSASSSLFSNTGTAYFGGTATSTFNSAGALTLASALAVTSGGTGATSLDNLITLGTHTTGNYLATLTNAGGLTVANSGSETAGVTIAIDTANPNTWTGLQQFTAASTTRLSVYGPSYFGGTATSTFDTAGNLNLASGAAYSINGTSVLNANTLGSGITASSLTSLGTLSSLSASGLSTLTGGILANNSTSTITNLTMVNSTSTNATTTNLAISGLATAAGTFLAVNPNGQVIATTTPTSGIITIEENNSTVTSSATVIDFLGADFTVTGASGEGDVAIDYANSGITRVGQNETVTGSWTLSGLTTMARASSSLFSNTGTAYFGGTATSTFDSAGILTLINSGLHVFDTNASHDLIITPGSDLTADRILTITTGDSARTLTLTGDTSLTGTNSGDVTLAGTPDYITISGQVITRGTIDIGDDTNLAATYPLILTGDTLSSALATTSSNTWAGTQTFNDIVVTDATTTSFTVGTDYLTDITGGGLTLSANALTVDDVTPTMLQSADFGDFTCNGTSCALDSDSITLATDTTGNYVATLSSSGSITVANSGSENAAVTANLNMGNANTWTALQSFSNASSSLFSNTGTAYFGGTATSSFSSTGALTLASALGIASGGTNNTSFSNNSLLFYNGTSIVSTSTSPLYVGAIVATSTTATTTISTGGLAVATNKLVVQQTSGNVGIGTASPTTGLDVDVASDFSGDVTVSGGSTLTISSTGAINQTGSGQVTFAGNVDATNGLDVTNANFTVGGNKLTVAPATGNTAVAGTIAVTGAAAASSTLQVTGATRLYSTLTTDGALTASAAGTGLSVTNNASVGGTLAVTGAATLSNNLAVTGTLSAAATTLSGNLAMGSNRITGLANPSSDNDAANKTYVDSIAQGLSLKDSVRVGTTANITLSGEQTIDGVSVVAGNRVLVKNQSTASQNGIYTAASGAWSRSTDADESSEVTAGMFTFITEGSTNANSGWVLTTTGTITLGSTSLSFTQFSGAGSIIAGTGMTKSGNTLDVAGTTDRITANADSIDIASTYVGQASITTTGALSSGSIGSSFGAIDIGADALTAGAISGTNVSASGNLAITGTSAFTGNVTMSGTLAVATTTLSGDIVMSGKKITGLADPSSAQEAATKAYVDSVAQGLTVKEAARGASTANLTLSGEQTVDGVALVAGDRILVKNQSTGSQNGIYVVASGAWSRSSDANENGEIASGMYVFVSSGTTQANTGWSLTTTGSITIDSTSLAFTQFSGSTDITAGAGLTKTGTTIDIVGTANRITVAADAIDIAATYVGQSSITTTGALVSGSIASGFGNINIGASTLAAGESTFATTTSFGDVAIGRTATTTIKGNSATSTFSGGISLAAGNLNLATGGSYLINNINILNATTLGSSVVSSSLTGVGTLASGAISAGFGAIDIGADTLAAGATTLTTLSASGLSTLTGGILANNATSTITNLTMVNATTTSATTTNFAISGLATAAGTLLAVDPNGRVVATSTPQGTVTSVSNSNGTLTISPTTGAVVASLNLGNANTWTALQTFSSGLLSTSSSTITSLTMVNSTSTSATTTNLAISGLATAAGTFLAVNPNGQVIATTTPTSGIITIEENNSTVTSSATVIDFLGADFTVTGASGEGDIAIDYANSGITRVGQNETVTGAWTFSGLSSFARASSTLFSNTGTAYFGGTATSTFDSSGVLTLVNSGLHLFDTNSSHDLIITPGSDLTADRILTITTGDSARTLTLTGDTSLTGTNTGDVTLAGTPDYITISGQVITRNTIDIGDDTNLAATYPLILTGDTLSSALATTSSNTWAGTQTFNDIVVTDATTTSLTVGTDYLTDITGGGLTLSGNALTVDDVTPTMLQSADFGDFTCNGTTCSLDNDTVAEAELDLSAVTLNDFTNDAGFVTTSGANTWTSLQQFARASSTMLSVYGPAYFGATATSSFDTAGNLNLASGAAYSIAGASVLNATTLGSNVVASSLTSVGALNGGSITSGFGAIDIGTDGFTGGNLTLSATGTAISLGVGSTTPWGRFSVELDTYNPAMVVANQGSSSPAFYIGGVNQNGRIGIGTKTPNDMLEVSGNIALTDDGTAKTIGIYQGSFGTDLTVRASDSGDITAGHLNLTAGSAGGGTGGNVNITSGNGFAGSDGSINLSAPTTGGAVNIVGQIMNIGSAGVKITADGDGALTLLGLGDGSDENLVINFDDTANEIDITSSTGVTRVDYNSLIIESGALQVDTAATGVNIDTDGDGMLILLGTSTGADEDLRINLDDTANVIEFTSTTGATEARFSSIGLLSTASSTIGAGGVTTGLTVSGTATTTLDVVVLGQDIQLGSAGVKMTDDGDGAITFLGLGNGNDESLTLNLDDTSNQAVWTTGTSISLWDLQSMGLNALELSVGTTSPWGDLSVEMDTDSPSFVVANQGSTTPAFFIGGVNANGKIGIGTASPSAILDITGDVVQTFTGTTGDAHTITASSLTTGSALVLTGPSATDEGVDDALLKLVGNVENVASGGGLFSSTATLETNSGTVGNNVYVSTVNSNEAVTGTGIYNTLQSTVVNGVVGQTNYGIYNTVSKTGNDTAGATETYGIASLASNTGSSAGTKNTYGGYFSATGSTGGSAVTYGLYSTASGGDLNYAGYFDAGDVAVVTGNLYVSAGNSIVTSGKFGVGSSTPYATISVTNTGSGPSLVVEDSTSPDTTPFIITAAGDVGIGTTTPWRKFSVDGTVSFLNLTSNTGAVTASICLDSNNQVTRNTQNETCVASSQRFKHNIESLPEGSGLADLMDLRPVTFEYNDPNLAGIRYGFIAEEVEQVDDLLVGYDNDGLVHSVRHLSMIPLMTQAIQELKGQVDILQLQIDGGGVAGLALNAPLQTSQLTVGEIVALDGQKITFNNDVVLLGRPYFNSDTGGFAEIAEGDKEVDVTFDEEYSEDPVVNVTLAADENDEEEIFDADIRYLVTEKGTTGFTIKLNKNAPEKLMFNWIALAVKDAKTFHSEMIEGLTLPSDDNDNNGSGGGNNEEQNENNNEESQNDQSEPEPPVDETNDEPVDEPSDEPEPPTDEPEPPADEPADDEEVSESEPPAEEVENSDDSGDNGGSEEPAEPENP